MKLSGLLFVLSCVLVQNEVVAVSQPQAQPSPSVGDIYLIPGLDGDHDATTHRVQVYLPQLQHGQWGEICMNMGGNGDVRDIGSVICRQFGRTSGLLKPPPVQSNKESNVSVWLRDVDCPPSVHHILRCNYKVTNDGSGCTPAYVTCDDGKLTYNDNAYQGQTYLCPPKDFKMENRSTSTGLVLLYLHHSWGTINYTTPITSGTNEMDTLCRQLGFTRSTFQSGMPSYDYSHCYQADYSSLPYANDVWLTADQFKCGESKACSGCCYRYPSPTSNKAQWQIGNLQLSCTFDPETKDHDTEGNRFLCSFNDTKDLAELKSSACAAQDESSSKNTIIIGSVLGFATLMSLLLALTGCVYYVHTKRHQHRQGDEGRPLLQGQAQPQRQRLQNLQNNDEAGN